jgi:hypothetical protein
MKITRPNTTEGVEALFKRLNHGHDASLKKLCFVKQRTLDKKSGSLIYPSDKLVELALCDVTAELLLNSYAGAKKTQTVTLECQGVTSFKFCQTASFDYSDLYEVRVKSVDGKSPLKIMFFATSDKILAFELCCRGVVCKES